MPWQRLIADVGGELLPDGRPAYRHVAFTVPRQSGKTTLVLSWEVQRAIGWAQTLGQRQRIVYSAQTGKDAREKLVEDQHPILEPRRKLLGIKTLRVAAGSEGVLWRNGSRLGLMGGTDSAGHGKTVDLAVKDELFADVDFRRDQALSPAMVTRQHAQTLTASTMGTVDSIALNAEVAAGRAAVESGSTSGTAYFEWSADDSDDPGDPAVWARCMPALGLTITEEVIQHEYDAHVAKGAVDEFRRAFLNVMTAADERVIPPKAWDAVNDPDVEAHAEMFAFDVNPERSAAGIVAVGDGPVIEVVDYRPGVGWLVDRLVELHDKYTVPIVVCKTAQAGSFIEELEQRYVKLVVIDGPHFQHVSGLFYDAVMNATVKIRHNSDLDNAVAGAIKRLVGDSWAWDRKNSRVDISLLVAASAGRWGFEYARPPKPFVM
jgi:hypothetical protein